MKLESLSTVVLRWLDWRRDPPSAEPSSVSESAATPVSAKDEGWLDRYLFDRDSREDGVESRLG